MQMCEENAVEILSKSADLAEALENSATHIEDISVVTSFNQDTGPKSSLLRESFSAPE
jgi:hypothetical protein